MDAGSTAVAVTLDRATEKLRAADGSEFGTLAERQAKILHTLEEVDCINLRLCCEMKCGQASGGRKSGKGTERELQGRLCTIIYGPFRIFDAVGDYVSQCRLYLQDPLYCNRDVPYRNPHLLSGLDEGPPMASSFCRPRVPLEVEEMDSRPDLFALLRNEDPLPETDAPAALSTTLYGYGRHDQAPCI